MDIKNKNIMEHIESIKIFALIGLVLAVTSFIGVIRLGVTRILNGFKNFKSFSDFPAALYLLCFCATGILAIELSLRTMPGNISAFLIIMIIAILWLYLSGDENNSQNEEEPNELKGLWLWFKNHILFLKSKLSEQQVLKTATAFHILSQFFVPIFFIVLFVIGAGLAYFLFIVKVLPVFPVIYLLLIIYILWIFAQFLELLLCSSYVIIIMMFIIKNKIVNEIAA